MCLKIKSFFESKIEPLIPLDAYVIDFTFVDDVLKVIELNPFGETAGAAPFNWNDPKDREILLNGPFTTRRVLLEDLPKVPSPAEEEKLEKVIKNALNQ